MARTRIDDVKHRRLASMTTDERAEFDAAYATAVLGSKSASISAKHVRTKGRANAAED